MSLDLGNVCVVLTPHFVEISVFTAFVGAHNSFSCLPVATHPGSKGSGSGYKSAASNENTCTYRVSK